MVGLAATHLRRSIILRLYRHIRRDYQYGRNLSNSMARRNHSDRDEVILQSSSLFVSNSVAQHTAVTQINLNLLWRLGGGLQALEKNVTLRGDNSDLKALVEEFKYLQELNSRKITLERERDSISEMMKHLVKTGNSEDVEKSKEVLISRGKKVKETLKALMPEWWRIEERVMLCALRLPNDLHPQTPAKVPVVLKECCSEKLKEGSSPVSHVELGRATGMIKFSNVGPTAYYLRGDLAVLEQTLQSYLRASLHDWGFTQLSSPEIFRSTVVEGSGVDIHDPREVLTLSYQLDDRKKHVKIADAYHLAGVSAASFTAFLLRTHTATSSLPLKYCTLGRSYSSKGVNYAEGLYATGQSSQGHVMVGCHSIGECDQVKGHLEDMLMELYRELELPVRLIRIAAPDLTVAEMYRSEVQLWAPMLQKYTQVGYVSILGDVISRRLNIHTGEESQIKDTPHYLWLVHGCVLNITRILAAYMEYHYNMETSCFNLPGKIKKHSLVG